MLSSSIEDSKSSSLLIVIVGAELLISSRLGGRLGREISEESVESSLVSSKSGCFTAFGSQIFKICFHGDGFTVQTLWAYSELVSPSSLSETSSLTKNLAPAGAVGFSGSATSGFLGPRNKINYLSASKN